MKKSLVDDPEHCRATHARWLDNIDRDVSQPDAPDTWFSRQCLTCAYFVPLAGALADDWGVCSNATSPRDGRATFEHDGCDEWVEAEEFWQRTPQKVIAEPPDD